MAVLRNVSSVVALTFTEHEVRGDVKGLDLNVIHGDGDGLLVVTGDEGQGLLCCAHKRVPGWGHQGRQAVGAGCVLPSCIERKRVVLTEL